MMRTSRIWRNEGETRIFNQFRPLIEKSRSIYIAVAFLTSSGLDLIKPALESAVRKRANIKVVAGTDFFHTDPRALRLLLEILSGSPGCELGTFKPDPLRVFHPKLYGFQLEDMAVISAGSANLTGGGLNSNDELGITLEVASDSEQWRFIEQYYADLKGDSRYQRVDRESIAIYEKAYRKAHPKIERHKANLSKLYTSDRREDQFAPAKINILRGLVNEYRENKEASQRFQERKTHYEEAHRLLNKLIRRTKLEDDEIFDIYRKLVHTGSGRLWWSTGMERRMGIVKESPRTFRKLVQTLHRNISSAPYESFSRGIDIVEGRTGLGTNVLSEVLQTLSPYTHCIVNRISVNTVSRLTDIYINEASQFDAYDYKVFQQSLTTIRDMFHFESMGEVDHFLYWVS